MDGVLDIRDIDLIARGGLAIHGQVEVWLPDHAEEPEVLDAANSAHDADDLGTFGFECAQVLAIQLDGELAFDTADGLLHVVGDRLREVPQHPGNPFELGIHRGDQALLLLVKHRPPCLLGFQVHEVFGIEEPRRIRAVVRPANLADRDGDFGK